MPFDIKEESCETYRHDGFTITCDDCGAVAFIKANATDRGVDFVCTGCGRTTEPQKAEAA